MSRRVLIDTGPIVAIFSKADEHHAACTEALRGMVAPLLTSWPVLTEAAWLLRGNPDHVQRLLGAVYDDLFRPLALDVNSVLAIAAFLRKYQDRGAELADVCLLHLAEREGIDTVFTLDRRDFTVYRIHDKRKLKLVP